jgi:hypothetical protein
MGQIVKINNINQVSTRVTANRFETSRKPEHFGSIDDRSELRH